MFAEWIYQLYLAVHVLALLVSLGIMLKVLFAKPSSGQSGALLLSFAGCVYIFGCIVEILAQDVNGCYPAALVQYFGACIGIVSFTRFVSEMCRKELPAFVYGFECVLGIFVMWMLFTTRENHIFYRAMDMDASGLFPRFVPDRGYGFWFFVLYIGLACAWCMAVCIQELEGCEELERKRLLCMVLAMVCPWLLNFVRELGLTGGYKILGIGIAGALVLVGLALMKYGYFDAIALAGENALRHGMEGIMVINTQHMITYYNKRMEQIFGPLSLKEDIYRHALLADIFDERTKTLEREGRIYEMRVEPLWENGYVQGQMLWVLDITEHHKTLMQMNELVNRDALTGVFHMDYFRKTVEEYLRARRNGALVRIELCHFMLVNDRFGHQAGDELLASFGRFLQGLGENVLACRIGGAGFCLFCQDKVDAKELEALAEHLMTDFWREISAQKYAELIDVAVGITRTIDTVGRDFEKLYSSADKALYVAINRSKNGYYIL